MMEEPHTHPLDRMKLRSRQGTRDFYFRPDSSDISVIRQIFREKVYDIRRLRRFPELVKFAQLAGATARDPLIVDAGANIGASALYFASMCPEARVVCIEPDVHNYQLLVENTQGLKVRPLLGAVAATSKLLRVVDVGEGYWGYQTTPAVHEEADSIRAVTMNEIFDAHAENCFPFIVKIDIEGGEEDLFTTNVEWVTQTPLIIIELHDWLLPSRHTALPFLRCMAELDRDFVTIGEDVYSIANDLHLLLNSLQLHNHAKSGAEEISVSRRKAADGQRAEQCNHEQASRPSDDIATVKSSDSLDQSIAPAAEYFHTEIEILQSSEIEAQVELESLEMPLQN